MNSRVVFFRLSLTEHQQLRQIAEREGESVSEVVREALYQRYQIGSLAIGSPVPPLGCQTPQK